MNNQTELEQLLAILNDRYHQEDCHIGYEHSNGEVEGCSCWKNDPIQALLSWHKAGVVEELQHFWELGAEHGIDNRIEQLKSELQGDDK